MSQQTIGIGTVANDNTGDPFRTAFSKANSNFTELYSGAFAEYLAGNWYIPRDVSVVGNGSAPGSGSIRLYPVLIKELVTINALGVRVTTLSAGGNVQAAIYANNPATMRPTGAALASSASMSTASVANVNAAISLQLTPGLYWFATNSDNGTSILTAFSSTTAQAAALIGSSSQSACLGSGTGLMGLTVTQTFGTWPDLTSGSFAEVGSINSVPIVQFKIASNP